MNEHDHEHDHERNHRNGWHLQDRPDGCPLCHPSQRIATEPTPEMSEQQHHAEMFALADDDNLVQLLAWRCVKARAETGGFNGLLITDFNRARAALEQLLAGP